MNFSDAQVGDIVARIDNPEDRYLVTGFGECNGRRTWRGFNERGSFQGGTLMGSWEWGKYALVGRTDFDLFDGVKRPECEKTLKVEMHDKRLEIRRCPDEIKTFVVVRKFRGNWYYWADFAGQNDAERAVKDLMDANATATYFKLDERYAKPDLSSHSEKHIVEGCIALMQELNNRFLEYLDHMDIKPSEEDDKWGTYFSYFEIVQRLLLAKTWHVGGTSTRLKIAELGYKDPKDVKFEDTRGGQDE